MSLVNRLAASLSAAAALAAACVHVPPGATILTVATDDPETERALRLELWRVERALEDVKVRYDLDDIAIEVIVKETGGLGATRPGLDETLHVDTAIVTLNEQLLLEGHPDLHEILVGLFAHELVHAMQESRLTRRELARLATEYEGLLLGKDSERLRTWIMHFEQLTDMTAIALGYAEELVHQKAASEDNLARNHPPHVWDFYLKEDEIRRLAADEEELWRRIGEALVELELRSLTRWMGQLELETRSSGREPPG